MEKSAIKTLPLKKRLHLHKATLLIVYPVNPRQRVLKILITVQGI